MNQTNDLVPIDLSEMIGEARWELHQRQQRYPQLVREGKLNARLAGRQIDRMQAILDLLIDLNGRPLTTARRAA